MDIDSLKDLIHESEKPVSAMFDFLSKIFGQVRLSTETLLLSKLVYPSKSEEQLSTLPYYEIHDNIKKWCIENNIRWHYDEATFTYTFQGTLAKTLELINKNQNQQHE